MSGQIFIQHEKSKIRVVAVVLVVVVAAAVVAAATTAATLSFIVFIV